VKRPTGSLPKRAKRAKGAHGHKGPERAADLLREAQHLIVEAAGLLGSGPEDGGLWDAVAILVEQRETELNSANPATSANPAAQERSSAETS
jgi:hypothetical protein